MTAVRCSLCHSPSLKAEFSKGEFDYHRCRECRHVFVHPLPSAEQNRSYYELIHTQEYLDASQEWFRVLARRRMDLLQQIAGKGQPLRLLDVGAGHGFFLAEAASRGWEVLGIEGSRHPRQFAREKLGVEVLDGDIEQVWPDLGRREFDVVTFWHVLEHLERPSQVLEAAIARLAGGGLLVLNSPNLSSAIYHVVGRHWSWIYTPGHLQYFSTDSLARWLVDKGLELVRQETWTGAPNLYFLLEEAILFRLRDLLQRSRHRRARLRGNQLSRHLAGERHKLDRQFRLARWYERTPFLDAFLVRHDLGHELLLIARKESNQGPAATGQGT